jgi:hypothetical protein
MKYFCLLLFAFLQSISSFSQSADLPQVSVKANEFIINHKPFVLRGLNTSDPEKLSNQGHWNLAYFEAMKSWGANVVRFPVHPAAWRRLGKEKYLKLLDEGVLMARSQKMYVIIDWHSIGNLRTEMYQADGYETTQKETFEFWRTMAKHFKGNHTVAFFELGETSDKTRTKRESTFSKPDLDFATKFNVLAPNPKKEKSIVILIFPFGFFHDFKRLSFKYKSALTMSSVRISKLTGTF